MAGQLLSIRAALLALAAVALLLGSMLMSAGGDAQDGASGSITGLTLTSPSAGELVIAWSDPSPAPSDYRIAWAPASEGYLSYQLDNEAGRGNAFPDGSARSYTVDGLPAGVEYQVRIRARFNQGGDGAWSGPWASATVTLASAAVDTTETTTDAPPDPIPTLSLVANDVVTALSLSSDAAGELTATWSAPTESPDDYRVVWSKLGESWPSWRDADGNGYPTATSLTISGLDSGAEYRVRVRARFDRGTSSARSGPWTAAATHTVTAGDDQPLPRPTGLAATVVNGNVILTWDDPEDDRITGYVIFGGPHETLMTDLGETDSGTLTLTDTRAESGAPSYYAVRSFAGNEGGERSDVFSITPPAPPSRFMDPVVGETTITLTWEAPAGLSWDHAFGHLNGTLATGYQVLRGDSLDSLSVIVEDTGNTQTTYTDSYTMGDGVVYYGLRTLSADGSSALAVQRVGTPPPDPDEHDPQWTTLVSNLKVGSGNTSTISADGAALAQPFTTGPSEDGYELNTVRLRIRPASSISEVAVSVHADRNGASGPRLFKLAAPDSLDAEFDDFTAPPGSMLEANTTYWIVIRAVAGTAVLDVSTGTGIDDGSMSGFSLSAHRPSGSAGGSGTPGGLGWWRDDGQSRRGFGDFLDILQPGGQQSGAQSNAQSSALRSLLQGRDARDVSNVNAQAPALALGKKTHSDFDFEGDNDRYRVSLEAGVRYLVTARMRGPRLNVDVYNMANVKQASNDTNYACGESAASLRQAADLFFTPATAGDYFVRVGSYQDDTGSYSLVVKRADGEAADTSTTAEAAPGGRYNGWLHFPIDADFDFEHPEDAAMYQTLANNYDPDTHDVDWVKLSDLKAGTTYTIILRGPPGPLDLRVSGMYDAAGAAISGFAAVSSQTAQIASAKLRIFFTPEDSGDHYIEITARAGDVECSYNASGLWYTLELWPPADGPHTVTVSPVTAVTDGSTYTELEGARGIAVHTIKNQVYALVASARDDGFQIIDITDPTMPSAVGFGRDNQNSFTALSGPYEVATHTIGDSHYALITAYSEDGLQIVNITNPSSPTAVTALFDDDASFDGLDSPWDVVTHTIEGKHYALVAGFLHNGVQIIDISDPTDPQPLSSPDAFDTGFDGLGGSIGIAVHTIGSKHYALVAAYTANGVQIIDITNPASPTPVSHMSDDEAGFDVLSSPSNVATHTIDGRHYALVAASGDNGVQIIDFSDPRNPSPVASVTNGTGGFDSLDGAWEITVVTIRYRHYALVASVGDDAVQIIDFTDPQNPLPATALVDDEGGLNTMEGPESLVVRSIGGRYYGLVTSLDDDGVQIFELQVEPPSAGHRLVGNTYERGIDTSFDDLTLSVSATAAVIDDGTTSAAYPELRNVRGVAVHNIGNSHYLLGAAFLDNGFQIIDVTNPASPSPVADATDEQNGFTALFGANRVTTHIIGDSHYALITGFLDHAVQIVDISTPSTPTAVSTMVDGEDNFDRLFNPWDVVTHTIGGKHYALVTSAEERAVQIIDISDPTSPQAASSVRDGVGGFMELWGARGIAVHSTAGRHYALVAAANDNGVQFIDITDPENPTAALHLSDGVDGFNGLDGAFDIAMHEVDGRHYALVVSNDDNALQIIDITDPLNPTPAANVTAFQSGFGRLINASAIDTLAIRNRHYAVITSHVDDSALIVDFTDPRNPTSVTEMNDDQNGFNILLGARTVALGGIGDGYYGFIASASDNGVQIFELTPSGDTLDIAARFRTGIGHSGQPYTPTSFRLSFSRVPESVNPQPVVSLHLDDNGRPGYKIATLIPPADLTQAILSRSRADFTFRLPDEVYSLPDYAYPGEARLFANRDHWIVVEFNERMQVGVGSERESTGLPYHSNGWNIANSRLARHPSGWEDSLYPLYLEISGYERIPSIDR